MKKTAVVLFNLGGPDDRQAVKPFLFNLFSDPAIIGLPTPVRQMLAWLLASRRAGLAKDIYAKIGGGSPILKNTQAQAAALEKNLQEKNQVKCFVAMRYWPPFAKQTAHQVKDFAPDEIVLLPLYPQFSTTTTASSLKSWKDAMQSAGIAAPTKTIRDYPTAIGFIASIASATRPIYDEAKKHGPVRLLFSAHGLPEKIVRAGDPYQTQCEQTAAALAKALNLEEEDWVLCYQSRVGPLQWIGPAVEGEISREARDQIGIVIVPISFVNEHSETLYEIDGLYRDLAAKKGVPYFARVQTVGTSPDFIEALSSLVRQAAAE